VRQIAALTPCGVGLILYWEKKKRGCRKVIFAAAFYLI
jgi:hypothetical protein